jgi:hypothetical protein
MSTKRSVSFVLLTAFATVAVLGATSQVARAASVYPGNKCVSDKMKAAAKKCKSIFKAWADWEETQDTVTRDLEFGEAAVKFDESWTKANDKALTKDVDCTDMTLSSVAMEALIDAAIADIVTEVNDGLNLANPDDAKCGKDLLKAAGKKCDKFLKAESTWVKKLAKDPTGADREEAQNTASTKFSQSFANELADGCPTTATAAEIEDLIDELSEEVVLNTTVSPNVDDTQFTTITLPIGTVIPYQGRDLRPICSKNGDYSYFVKRGSTNKLLVYFQGGGACWDFLTCELANVFDNDVNPAGSDNPNNTQVGLGDQGNSLNPFAEWNVVFVSYCTGDIHFGDSEQTYSGGGLGSRHIEHRGFVNARVVEKFAREHFVNPEEVFVTGSSAGAYGAFFNAPLLRDIYPASKFNVLADAGNGIVTQQFLDEKFPVWNFAANLPTHIPGLSDTLTNGTGIPGYTEIVANFYADVNWAHYTTAFDGGTGGQTGFYNVMLNPTTDPLVALAEWPKWWEASCEWNDVMRQQAIDTAAAIPGNYRYYIGTGSRHTMFGSNKVYTDTTGGVPTIVDWINALRDGTPAWTNVEATNQGLLLAGDPAPDPLVPPFGTSGPDTVITCP